MNKEIRIMKWLLLLKYIYDSQWKVESFGEQDAVRRSSIKLIRSFSIFVI